MSDTNKICCYAHPDAPLIDYRADQIWSECGRVVGDRVIDVGSEWRTFSNEKAGADPSRVGGPENPLLNGSDLSTMIGPGKGDASFDGFGASKYHNCRTMTSSDTALINAFREISTMADHIHSTKTIVDRANNLFKQVHDGKNLKGRSKYAIASACLYIACREEGVPRTFLEICAVSKMSKKEIGRCFKLIVKAGETSVGLFTSSDFMCRFCANLGLPNMVQRAATHIARKAVDFDIVPGHSPISIAAAAIYMASQASEDKRSQKEIGDIAGVADVTIRQSYQLMFNHAARLFPEDFKFATPIEQLPQIVIDVGSEWQAFSNEKAGADPSRVDGPENPLLNGSDLSTMIGPGRGDASFDGFGASKYHNRRTMTSSDRALINPFREISTMADRINLTKTIVDRANNLFKQVHDGKNLKERSNYAIASACLYIACRQEGMPRTFKEICAVSKMSKKEIERCFKLILKARETSVELITTSDFICHFCANLGLPNMVQRAATHIARKAVDIDIVPGHSPIPIAAAAIYMASQASEDKRSQKEIGHIAGVPDVTIRQSYKLMFNHAARLFPEDFKFATPIEQLPQM